MKLKSLLYGTAAVLVSTGASTGAMAADLPVAAEPVEYVRVCDAFGKGFFYIPGTDTCLKVGGRVRVEAYIKNTENDNDDQYETRARGYVNLDARNETDYGLLRTYVALYWTHGSGGNSPTNYDNTYSTGVTLDDAFISLSNDSGQWTFGRTSSFFDFFGGYSYQAEFDSTQDATLFAYTFNIGNGVSGTLSLEDPYTDGRKISDGGFFYGGQDGPDVVANLRVDQGWGSAQIMGALRNIQPKQGPFSFVSGTTTATATTVVADVGDEWGWAIGAGFEVAIPGVPVEFAMQAGYTEGMVAYVTGAPHGLFGLYDAVALPVVAGFSTELTEAWQITGGLNIAAAPNVSIWVDGYYGDVDQAGSLLFAGFNLFDYDYWGTAVGAEWKPGGGLSIGAEVAYSELSPGGVVFPVGAPAYLVDTDDWTARIRFQRTF